MAKVKDYRVVWECDITARTPREAARLARKHQIREHTTATVFDCTDETGKMTRVDLMEPGPGYVVYPASKEVARG